MRFQAWILSVGAAAALTQPVWAQPPCHGPGGPGGPPPHHHPPAVQVTGWSGQQLELQREGGWQKATLTDGSTRYFRGRETITSADIHPGDFVDVRESLQMDGRLHADEVRIRPDPPVHGRIMASDADSLTIDFHHQLIKVDLTPNTRYYYGWLPGTALGLVPGAHVHTGVHPVGANHFQADFVSLELPWRATAVALGLSGAMFFFAYRRRRVREFRPRHDD